MAKRKAKTRKTKAKAKAETASVVPQLYRERYGKDGHCGDQTARKLAKIEDLVAFAKANGLWKSEYKDLNPGQQRMCVGNRARAKVRKGEALNWS